MLYSPSFQWNNLDLNEIVVFGVVIGIYEEKRAGFEFWYLHWIQDVEDFEYDQFEHDAWEWECDGETKQDYFVVDFIVFEQLKKNSHIYRFLKIS